MDRKPYLIVVDDEVDIAEFVRDAAMMVGYEVEAVSSVRRFLALLDEREPDVIVTDIVMPDIDGIELINELTMRGVHSKVIIMSGFEGKYLDVAGEYAAANGLSLVAELNKPMRLDDIEKLLEQVKQELAEQ